MDGRIGAGHDMEYDPIVAIGDTRYRVGSVGDAGEDMYDVTTDDGHPVARLSRPCEGAGAAWTVERWSDELDTRTLQDVVRVAFERSLVAGHTGSVHGALIAVERGFASIELATGTEVWVPCGAFAAELQARARLGRGERDVTVRIEDGVPVAFDARAASSYRHSRVVPAAVRHATPPLRRYG